MAKPRQATSNEIDSQAAIRRVMEMIAIPGKSGQERQVLDFIRGHLNSAGVEASAIVEDNANRRSPIGGEAGNLIVKLPGTQRGPRRLLMAHVDTVPLCVGARPVRLGAYIESRDPQTALGGDDRAGASVILTALLEIQRRRLPHPPLTFLWAVQEEAGLYGSRFVSLSKLGRPRLCFNWDGGDANVVVVGATGDYSMDIEVAGIASHAGACPERGVSAAAIAALAVADLVESGWHGLIVKGGKSGTSNVGVINGGDATNVVLPHLRIRAEARSHDPKFRKQIVAAIRAAFSRAVEKVRNIEGKRGQVRFDSVLKYESFRLPNDDPSVRAALAAIEAAGLRPGTRIANGGLDANWLTAHGHPTATLGCGQANIHTVDEVLHVDGYLDACRIALSLATSANS
jgi:tripeptide aminopeptidase